MNNDSVNLYCYCSDRVFLHNFTWFKIWVKVGLSWLKCRIFSIILALMRVLKEGLYTIQNNERSQCNLLNFRLG